MARYWDLANVNDAKYCYFQEIDFETVDNGKPDIYPIRPTVKEAIIDDSLEKEFRMDRNYKQLSYVTGSCGIFFSYLYYLAL
jgi:hypothetical protein